MNVKSPDEMEDGILNVIAERTLDHERIVEMLRLLNQASGWERADAAAAIYQEELARRGEKSKSLSLLEMRAMWHPDSRAFASVCGNLLSTLWTDRRERMFIRNAGFDAGVSAVEALRRFRTLISLRTGSVCSHPSWGWGVVREIDDFDERVIVDFEKRPAQSLRLAHAAEVLMIASEDHFMVLKITNPQTLVAMARNDPASLVRLVLRSLGPLTADRLKETLEGDIVPAGEWKIFWDNARRMLKDDPMVQWPVRRSDPIALLNEPVDIVRHALERLEREWDPEQIVRIAREMRLQSKTVCFPPEAKDSVAKRLLYAAEALVGRSFGMAATALTLAESFDLLAQRFDEWQSIFDVLLHPSHFGEALSDMPVREMRLFVRLSVARAKERMNVICSDVIDRLPLTALEEFISCLAQNGSAGTVAESLKINLSSSTPSLAIVAWCCRHVETCREWNILSASRIAMLAITQMGMDCCGKDLKARQAIQNFLEDEEALKKILDRILSSERVELFRRIRDARGWDEVARRSVMARMIRAYPELSAVAAAGKESAVTTEMSSRRLTSFRSFKEKQRMLRKIVEVEIPRNSREIAVARSYGDLRENAEYKFAKEHQRLLMKRQEDLERELKEVIPTDFSSFSSERAGMGTSVRLTAPDGSQKTCCILGEWDGNEELGIISCKSAVATELIGHAPGDEVFLPDSSGGRTPWKIASVEPLSGEIIRWARGEDSDFESGHGKA